MILVVDDHEDLRRVAMYMLRYDGYEVYGAGSGQEALDFLDGKIPHCVILDYHMPGMLGTEVLSCIRKDNRLRDVRVIMFSADPNIAEVSMEAGADAFVEKSSLDWAKLSKLVEQHCGPVQSSTDGDSVTPEAGGKSANEELQMIWVVAAQESTRRTLCSLISDRGYEVDEIECSDNVPRRLHFRRPVLIIVDCHIEDSFDLVRRMRDDPQAGSVPIVMFSVSDADNKLREKAILKGADAFVSKRSLDWVELFQEIRRFAGPPS